MPTRFGISSFGENEYSAPEIVPRSRRHFSDGCLSGSPVTDPSKAKLPQAVRLSCLSPERKQWHSVLWKQGKYVLLSRAVEETGDVVQQAPQLIPPVMQVVLPDSVQDSLSRDPPIELFCVEAEGTELSRLRMHINDQRIGLPRLCIYSETALFVIQSAFDPSTMEANLDTENTVVQGEIASFLEPFEQYILEKGSATRLLRARSAPQRWTGHAVHSPSGCLALLVEDSTNHEYHLPCLESNGKIKQPVFSFCLEHIVGADERIVDFCFAQSSGLSLLSSLSVLLLKGSGDILAASPFVFNGSLVPRPVLEESMEYLQTTLERLDRSHPQWRQYRAARQFLSDIFPQTDRRTRFVTAKTSSSRSEQNASGWPLKLQGPILFRSELEESSESGSTTLECFGKAALVGFAIGGLKGQIDFGITSPTTIIPRFAFESRKDAYVLDDLAFQCSAWVERVGLGFEMSDALSIALYQDPNFESILHVVSRTLVASISSNCVRIASTRVRDGSPPSKVCTVAWSYLENLSSLVNVQGVVANADDLAGHQLLIQFTNGSVQAVNVSEKKSSRELQIVNANSATTRAVVSTHVATPEFESLGRVSNALKSNPPFHETASLQIAKVNKGLASLAKFVGSETRLHDITPDKLAVVASIQEHCENKVVLPVLELARMIESRRDALDTLLEEQNAQVVKLMERREEIEKRNACIREALKRAEARARDLRDRSNAAYELSRSLAPTVTDAESEFFRFVEQMDTIVSKWEIRVREVGESIRKNSQSLEGQSIPDGLGDKKGLMNDMRILSDDTERRLINTRQALKETELRLHAVLRKAGLEAPSENVSSNLSAL